MGWQIFCRGVFYYDQLSDDVCQSAPLSFTSATSVNITIGYIKYLWVEPGCNLLITERRCLKPINNVTVNVCCKLKVSGTPRQLLPYVYGLDK